MVLRFGAMSSSAAIPSKSYFVYPVFSSKWLRLFRAYRSEETSFCPTSLEHKQENESMNHKANWISNDSNIGTTYSNMSLAYVLHHNRANRYNINSAKSPSMILYEQNQLKQWPWQRVPCRRRSCCLTNNYNTNWIQVLQRIYREESILTLSFKYFTIHTKLCLSISSL